MSSTDSEDNETTQMEIEETMSYENFPQTRTSDYTPSDIEKISKNISKFILNTQRASLKFLKIYENFIATYNPIHDTRDILKVLPMSLKIKSKLNDSLSIIASHFKKMQFLSDKTSKNSGGSLNEQVEHITDIYMQILRCIVKGYNTGSCQVYMMSSIDKNQKMIKKRISILRIYEFIIKKYIKILRREIEPRLNVKYYTSDYETDSSADSESNYSTGNVSDYVSDSESNYSTGYVSDYVSDPDFVADSEQDSLTDSVSYSSADSESDSMY